MKERHGRGGAPPSCLTRIRVGVCSFPGGHRAPSFSQGKRNQDGGREGGREEAGELLGWTQVLGRCSGPLPEPCQLSDCCHIHEMS